MRRTKLLLVWVQAFDVYTWRYEATYQIYNSISKEEKKIKRHCIALLLNRNLFREEKRKELSISDEVVLWIFISLVDVTRLTVREAQLGAVRACRLFISPGLLECIREAELINPQPFRNFCVFLRFNTGILYLLCRDIQDSSQAKREDLKICANIVMLSCCPICKCLPRSHVYKGKVFL